MQKPPLDPDVADVGPSDSVLTVYDEEHELELALRPLSCRLIARPRQDAVACPEANEVELF